MGWHIAYAMLFVIASFGVFRWGVNLWKDDAVEDPKVLAIFLWLTALGFFLKAINSVFPG